MLQLLGGVELAIPKSTKVFDLEGISRRTLTKKKVEMWTQAFNQCLIDLHFYSESMYCKAISNLGKANPKVLDHKAVAHMFLCEMRVARYISFKFERDGIKNIRSISINKKLKNINIAEFIKTNNYRLPKFEVTKIDASNCIRNKKTVSAVEGVQSISEVKFKINPFIHEVLTVITPKNCLKKESTRMPFLTTMRSAEVLRDEEFYFSHFFDYRGRINVRESCGVNPQGSDYEKALLSSTFCEKLSDSGLQELLNAIEGYSEKDFDIEETLDHARNPYLNGGWQEADCPYSYLACAKYLLMYYEDNEALIPAFRPLDGRCSGIQHWSALMRSDCVTDRVGMAPDNIDGLDIYEMVAKLAKATISEPLKELVTRKSCKTIVMTFVYGSTLIAAFETIRKMYPDLEADDVKELATTIFEARSKGMSELQEGMDYLKYCIKEVYKTNPVAKERDFRFASPDGMSFSQNKDKFEVHTLKYTDSKGEVNCVNYVEFLKIPNVAKHVAAISPNFIHMLDATHLRMIARRMRELGLPLVTIHDSMSTHVNYTGILYDIIKEEFVKLYSEDQLQIFRENIEERYKISLKSPPESVRLSRKAKFLSKVLESNNFFG